jgi:hypothetical protein
MDGSIQRVRAVINGDMPDRAPLFDLLRNDEVIKHFTGRTLTVENAPKVVYRAYEPAIDATRPVVRMPGREETVTLADGRQQRHFRWTTWTERVRYPDSDSYAAAKRKELKSADPAAWGPDRQKSLDDMFGWIEGERRKLGEVFFMPGIASPGLMGIIGEVGLEQFSYIFADYPGIIVELLERNTIRAVTLTEHYPEDHGIEVGFLGDDIAFNSGPFLSPDWMRKHYSPRLERIIAAWHRAGIKILFHSDGNLNPILNDLVEAGIDGLNPIEILAGMNVGEIHRRHPHLFLVGGIDVSQLLPLGTPAEVKDAVKGTLDEAEGRIMIGSSTELNNEVPLSNFLAMREAVMENPYS